MMLQDAANLLLQNAIGVIPIAIIVAVLCKSVRMRPATRHMLWLGVLVFLIIPPTFPEFSRSLFDDELDSDTTAVDHPSEPVAAPRSEPAPIESSVPAPERVVRRSLRTHLETQVPRPATTGQSVSRTSRATGSFERPTRPRSHNRQAPALAELPVRDDDSTLAPSPARRSAQSLARPAPLTVAIVTWRSARQIASRAIKQGMSRVESGVAALRSATGALPAIPAWLWFGGVFAVLMVAVARLALACRLFRHAEPAPDPVRTLIGSASEQMGLRRAPRTLMVEDRVSPMIWCGWRTTLVLPKTLWNDLDAVGRRAVVQHELAHIRRRDHWVRWVELFIGTLYWWHPIVWWARRRVHEEADLSCDLWVTALAPGIRAPYARALLMTKQYVSAGGGGVPVVGIGAVSPGAKRFSRRITMVMTTRMNPRASIVGVALAASLVLGGVYSAPSWACDTPGSPEPATAPVAPEAPKDLSTFEQYMIDRTPAPESAANPWLRTTPSVSLDYDSSPLTGGVVSALDSINNKLMTLATVAPGYVDAANADSFFAAIADDGAYEVTYHLPMDRLRPLTKLMAREDVPLLVEPLDDGIVVHGNAVQHQRFAAFVSILDPKEEIVSYRLTSKDKLDDLIELMSLDTVPTLINPGDNAIRVHGDAIKQRAFREFVLMIDPGAELDSQRPDGEHNPAVRADPRSFFEDEAARVEQRVLGMFEEAERLREMEATIMAQAEAIEAQADQIEEQSDQQRDQAESVLAEVEAIMSRAETLSEDEQYEAMVRAESAQNEAGRMLQLAEVIGSQIDMVMAQAEALAEEAESFGDQADELEEQAEDLADSLDEQLGELEEQMESRFDEFNEWTHEHAEALHELLHEHAERLDAELSQRFMR